jgi:TM2 domain-containing membrane protein YozV
MKGKILDFSVQSNSGVISADDGKRYTFAGSEWKSTSSTPRQEMRVDFEPNGESATGIYPDAVQPSQASNTKVVAAVLAFFLGAFGAHKFYLGIKKPAIIMLCVSVGGFILIGIPTMVMAVIAFVEFIIYLTKSDEDFHQTYVVGKKGWF